MTHKLTYSDKLVLARVFNTVKRNVNTDQYENN